MNINTLEKLDYYKLKEIVKGYCISGLGKNLIDKLTPSTSLKVIENRLNQTSEGRVLLDASYHIPFDGIFNVASLIERIELGNSLNPEDLVMISDFLRGSRKIKNFMNGKEFYAPLLSSYSVNITDLGYIEEEINSSIKGNRIDSNASKELKKIRRHIDNTEGKIKERLEKFLKSSSNKEYIQEFFVSQRNGKYTIPIKAAFKNHVDGTIVETSVKGSTVFIEPRVIAKNTTELAILKAEEAVEEYKILAILTELIYEKIKEIKLNIEIIAEYDMIWAKSKYSKEIDGIKPKLNERGYIKAKGAAYPLIEKPVLLDFEIGKDYRSLIITGPNAGGKTVVLKTLGLLTVALQSGFHIKADLGSEFSVFEKIYVDIGDNQSVENSLSTFSAHVKNLAKIVEETNKSTLLLFDEIGSGTEPNEGAALAIAILEELYQKGATIIATTHYGEIKNFSKSHPDFENAAMEFKKESLDPLYKLKIGEAGDSNALYIARKMGISDKIIDKTSYYIKEKNYDYTLIKESKVIKEKNDEKERVKEKNYEFSVGDRVIWLDKEKSAIIYKEKDNENNLIIFYNKEYIKVNFKRLKLENKASELYPKDYDLNQLFINFKERKLEKDIERGSKKALKTLMKNKNFN